MTRKIDKARLEIEVEDLGQQGDGLAHHQGVPLYIDMALPGDRLSVQVQSRRGEGYAATPVHWYHQAPRVQPLCRHFGGCGGCQLQHMEHFSYLEWKARTIETALSRRGIKAPLRPPVPAALEGRRRVRLAFAQKGRILGFRARQAHQVIDLDECPVSNRQIVSLFAPLRMLLGAVKSAGATGELQLTLSESGLDLLLQLREPPNLADLEQLVAFAERHDLARLCWRQGQAGTIEPVAIRRKVAVRFGSVLVDLPPGAFLQATPGAERAIQDAVREAIGEASSIVDLYAGCGALSLPLAGEGRRLLAVEREDSMIAALAGAANQAGFGGRLAVMVRDLDRLPLLTPELSGIQAAIVDPPRSGARSQAQALADSPIRHIAMVSCNPQTFARDARILIDGGYLLSWIQPIDAFLWSSQIELVAAFIR